MDSSRAMPAIGSRFSWQWRGAWRMQPLTTVLPDCSGVHFRWTVLPSCARITDEESVKDIKEQKLRLDSNLFRRDRTLSAYLAIAVRAAREAKLLHLVPSTDDEARSLLAPLLVDHTTALKTFWLRQPNGGIKGWQAFLTLLGYRERLTVQLLKGEPATERSTHQTLSSTRVEGDRRQLFDDDEERVSN
jgi:hypothetical protein